LFLQDSVPTSSSDLLAYYCICSRKKLARGGRGNGHGDLARNNDYGSFSETSRELRDDH